MKRPWHREIPLDDALFQALVAESFPHLAPGAPEHLGAGWDSDVWRWGDYALRFPRRAMGVDLLHVELRVLPLLAPRLPVAIPSPTHVGRPTEAFPYPFYAHRFVPGTTACRRDLSDAQRHALAAPIGAFLRALHALPPSAVDAPPDRFRSDLQYIASRALERLSLVPELGPRAEAALSTPPPNAVDGPVLLHGDLYARHLVLDDEGALTGVIDWGDVCVGDRAVDLRVVHAFLPPDAHPAFLAAYGPVAEATWTRARFLALAAYGVSVLAYANDVGDEALQREARRTLAWTLA